MSKKKNKKKIWIIIAVVVVVGGLIAANLLVKQKPKGTWVDVTTAELDSLVQTVTASGKIQPEVDVHISAEVSGRILFLGAKEGDFVEKGKLLVRIDDENYQASLEQNKYALASAEASLEEAKSNLKRTSAFHESNLASDAELEAMQASVKRLEADVDRVRANVKQAEDYLEKTRIYTPISGTVISLGKEVGEMAIGATFSQDVIMVVSQLEAMEVNVEVNENDVVLIETQDPVSIEIFAMPDTSFRGIVTEIAHSGIIRGMGTAEEVTNFEVKVAVLDDISEVRPGMSATVEIETERRENAIVLPQEAVAVRSMEEEKKAEERARKSQKGKKKNENNDENNGNKDKDEKEELVEVVYVVENDTAWVRQVKLGIYSDTHFEIVEGISEEEVVITGPFRALSREIKSGSRIEYDKPDMGEDGENETEETESEGEETVAAEESE